MQTSIVKVEHDEDPAREYVPEVQVLVQVATCKPAVAPQVPAAQSLHEVSTWPVAL
jgi:hypothetical protein